METSDNQLTKRQSCIDSVSATLQKFFSRLHKKRSREAIELIMADKINPAQLRALYHKLTGDSSVSDNKWSQEVDDRIKAILKTADESIIRDMRVNNARKSSFDPFWEVAAKKIKELSSVNDYGTSTEEGVIISYMAVAVSMRVLYTKCVPAANSVGLSKTPMSYTMRYMVQQRNLSKHSPDDHYCAAIFKVSPDV